MAGVVTQDPVIAWRRVANAIHSFKPSTQLLLMAFKSWLVQFGLNPELQFTPFGPLDDTETVLITGGGAGTLYALVLKKAATATATFSKLTDHASASSDADADLVIKQNVSKSEAVLVFNTGLSLALGAVMQGNTAASTGTSSGANAASGFALIGA